MKFEAAFGEDFYYTDIFKITSGSYVNKLDKVKRIKHCLSSYT